MPTVNVIIPVGPGDEESERCRDGIAALRAWEPGVVAIACIDDGPPGRLDRLDEVTVLPHPLRGQPHSTWDRITAGVLAGLDWASSQNADFTIKLDTDSVVIAPFAEKLATACADPATGVVGSYDRTCNNDPRSFGAWVGPVRELTRRREFFTAAGRRRRALIERSLTNGYVWGEHVLACAMGFPDRAVSRLRADGLLNDPCLFVGSNLSDDPALALLIRAVGLSPAGSVQNGELFAVAWRGLPDTPAELERRGYSVVHSVKNDRRSTEGEIRAYFAARRPHSPGRPASDVGD